jgi:hypothetical protein
MEFVFFFVVEISISVQIKRSYVATKARIVLELVPFLII